MSSFGVTVLRILNQEYHEKRYDCRAGIDNKLPGIGKVKDGTSNSPDNYDERSATINAHALPRTVEVERAKTENASVILERTSGCAFFFLAILRLVSFRSDLEKRVYLFGPRVPANA